MLAFMRAFLSGISPLGGISYYTKKRCHVPHDISKSSNSFFEKPEFHLQKPVLLPAFRIIHDF